MRARFRQRIAERLDGAAAVTVEIAGRPDALMFRVRPLRRRRVYELPLIAVARGVLYDVVRAELGRKVASGSRRAR